MNKEFLFQKYDVSKGSLRSHEFYKLLKNIKSDLFRGVKTNVKPVFAFATGPSGAGKSYLEEVIKKNYPIHDFVVLDIDNFRIYHPDSLEIISNYPSIASNLTTSFSKDIRDELLNYALEHNYNIIFSASINSVEKGEKIIAKIPKPYHISLYAIVTHPLEYRLTAEERYENEVFRTDFVPRLPDENYMKKCDNYIDVLPALVKYLDDIVIYRRLPSINTTYVKPEKVYQHKGGFIHQQVFLKSLETPKPLSDIYFKRIYLLLKKRVNRANVTCKEVERVFALADMYNLY